MTTILIVLFLLFMSGLFSGLNLGLMSLGKEELKRKIKLGDTRAKSVYKLRKNGNLLLCTILIGNVFVNNTLAIYMGDMFTGTFAIIVATGLIVIFGEVLPQALCSRYPLQIGSAVAPVFNVFMYALYPICWPLAWIMDKIFGPEPPVRHSKLEIGEMVNDHRDDVNSDIDVREAMTIIGALTFADKTVWDVMTPKKNVYRFYEGDVISDDLRRDIRQNGHTRIPVFKDKEDIVVGIILVKELLDVPVGSPVMDHVKKPIMVTEDTNLDDVLDIFRKSRMHLMVVVDEHENVLGIITLEDILEEIFQFEIMDESDKYKDMRNIVDEKA